jgi:hypothetical protein
MVILSMALDKFVLEVTSVVDDFFLGETSAVDKFFWEMTGRKLEEGKMESHFLSNLSCCALFIPQSYHAFVVEIYF